MTKKILKRVSFRDLSVLEKAALEIASRSVEMSSSAARAIAEVHDKFPNYRDRLGDDHGKAIDYILNSCMTFIDQTAGAHMIDKSILLEHLRGVFSEQLSSKLSQRRRASNDSLVNPEITDTSRQNSGNPTQTKIPRHVVKLKIDPKRKNEKSILDRFIPLGQQNLAENSKNMGGK